MRPRVREKPDDSRCGRVIVQSCVVVHHNLLDECKSDQSIFQTNPKSFGVETYIERDMAEKYPHRRTGTKADWIRDETRWNEAYNHIAGKEAFLKRNDITDPQGTPLAKISLEITLTKLRSEEMKELGCSIKVTIRNRGKDEPQLKVLGLTIERNGWKCPQGVFGWYCKLSSQRSVDRDDNSAAGHSSVHSSASATQPSSEAPSLADSSKIGSSNTNSLHSSVKTASGKSFLSGWL